MAGNSNVVEIIIESLTFERNSPLPTFDLQILPITLDTPMNRKWMPKADTSTWTSLDFVSELLFNWANGKERPASGSLVQLVTKGGKTELVCE